MFEYFFRYGGPSIFMGFVFIFIVIVWAIIIKSIIKAAKQEKNIRNVTNEVFRTANEALKNMNVHTGDPKNPFVQPKRTDTYTSDNYSEQRQKDSDTFGSDLNPRTTPVRVYKNKKTVVNGKKVRSDKVYGVMSTERPLHGKLSKESRDDEKEWF